MGGALTVLDADRTHPTSAIAVSESQKDVGPVVSPGKRDRLAVRTALHGEDRVRGEVEVSHRIGDRLVYVRQPVTILRSPLQVVAEDEPGALSPYVSSFTTVPHVGERLAAPSSAEVAFTTLPLTDEMLTDSEVDEDRYAAPNDREPNVALGSLSETKRGSRNDIGASRQTLAEIARRAAPTAITPIASTTAFRERILENDPVFRIARPGETLVGVLVAAGATTSDARQARRALGSNLVMGDRLKIVLDRRGSLDHVTIRRVGRSLKTLVRANGGNFVPVEEPASSASAIWEVSTGETGSLAASLRATLDQLSIAPDVKDKILGLVLTGVPPRTPVDDADLEVVLDARPDAVEPEHVRAVSLRLGADRFEFFRHRRPDGTIAFLDASGVSPQERLICKPIAEGRLTSGFGMRRHPVLSYRRLHSGTDYAAPRGTPIYAAGDGVVTTAGWKGGNGRFVAIDHVGGLRTTYSHMSAFADDVEEGSSVERGDVIGYVGTSGLSTGNHLHVELKKGGTPVDLRKTGLPSILKLWGTELADFKRNRDASNVLLHRS